VTAAQRAKSKPAAPQERRPPRTRKGRETREVLLKAAREVFERDGFTSARIADMMTLAELSYGSFYNYFDSKDEIFWAVLAEVRRDMLVGYSPDGTGTGTGTAAGTVTAKPARRTITEQISNIERSNADFIESFRTNAGMIRVMEEVATYNDEFKQMRRRARIRFIDRIERTVRRLQEHGVADTTLDPECTAHALGAMMDRFCYSWFVLGDEFDEETAVRTLNTLWYNALGIRRSRRPKPTG
jgi:AcrR family transcriptional regulator